MSALDAIARALASLADPLVVTGRLPAAPLTAKLPSGERVALEPPDVDALCSHAEPAPFGDGEETRHDPAVRVALRLKARGAVAIEGFDPKPLLSGIEDALSPAERLRATLVDVLVTPPGGHFALHQDTPMEAGMVGTLLVWMATEHEGGALRLAHHGREERVEGDARAWVWAAFAGDVGHEVLPVTRGHRVTLAYRLTLAGVRREASRPEVVVAAELIAGLMKTPDFLPEGGLLVLPCARHAIVEPDMAALEVRQLRGADRLLAEALAARGVPVRARAVLTAVRPEHATEKIEREGAVLAAEGDAAVLERPLGRRETRKWGEAVSFSDELSFDEDPLEVTSIEHLLRDGVPLVVPRSPAAAVFVHEGLVSPTGNFGNEYSDAYLYTFAAIEIDVPTEDARGLGPPPPPRPRVRHAKFGEGEVLSEDPTRGEPVLEIRFDSGETKKLLARFVERL